VPTTEPTVPTTEPTVPTTDPTVQPNTPTTQETTTTTAPDRCASNRGTKPHCSGDDPVDDPEEEVVVPETPTAPVVDPATTVAGGGEPASPAPVKDEVLAGDVERPAPAAAPMPAAALPRTGAGIGDQVTLAAALLAAGIALLRVFRRRRPSAQAS
jgi:LPXTG-motif cell wall-anchored protein